MTNTLAYYDMESITTAKIFMAQASLGLFNEKIYSCNLQILIIS